MKHLYIIGNGFDIFTGLKTRCIDFQRWLSDNYPFIYENLRSVYDIDEEWWCDFEIQLGKLDVKAYIKKFEINGKPIKEIRAEMAETRAFEKKYNLPPSFCESRCARRLRGLLDILQYCFEKWVAASQEVLIDPKYVDIDKEESFFINFNYTDVLQWLYKIPEDRVLHIHGRASKHQRLVFGHNSSMFSGATKDEDEICFELGKYEKNPYQYINKYDELPNILKDVEYVHIYGFSFSPVDIDYIEWICNNVPLASHWEVSWYSKLDKLRIESFVLEHWELNDKLKYIRLDDIKADKSSVIE